MIAFKNDKRRLIVFIIIQISIAQTAMMLLKAYSLGTDKDFVSFLISFCFYVFVFILPVVFYLRFIDKANVLTYLRLNSNMLSGVVKGILIGSFIFIFFLLRNKGHILRSVDLNSDILLILGKVLVGPLEEIPFRGFYLQKFKNTMSFPKANLLSSIIFACLHIAVMSGSGISLVYSLAYLMVIGLWMGYIFEKTQSLWCVSIVHSIYDVSIWLLF